MTEFYKRKPNTLCTICGKPIYKRPFEIEKNKGNVFCSSACYGVSCRKEKPCIVCGKSILSGTNKKTCSRACANKHRAGIKYKLHGPRKDKVKNYQALKNRLWSSGKEICERCGYGKFKILEVHHRNRDRSNNNIENIELLCPNCHAEEHYSGRG